MRKILMTVSISVLLAMTLVSTTVFASEYCTAEVKREVTFRDGPSSESGKYGKLPAGTVVLVLEYDSSATFTKVSCDGQIGYISSRFLTFSPHTLTTSISISTSCTDDSISRTYCTVCGFVQEEKVLTPAPGHDLHIAYSGSQIGTSFSCETGGFKTSWCRRDFCTYRLIETISPGHVLNEVSLIKPTYHSTGTQTMECERCGYRDYITIPMLIDDGMSPDVFAMGQAFFSGAWKLFGVYVPGFGFTFGGMYIGIVLVSLSLSVIYMVFGFGRRGGSVSARSGSTNKAKISKEREHDER